MCGTRPGGWCTPRRAGWPGGAGGWCGRILVRLLRWVFPALVRMIGLAASGLWWLLCRVVRYVLAYPEYLPLVRELEQDGHKARRVKAARDAWRRALYRRVTGVAVL